MTPPPRIAFRADAALAIGNGHVMRCLTLADALRDRGADCLFVCRPHAGHLMDLIAARGHGTAPLPPPEGNGWLGAEWEIDAAQTREALAGTWAGRPVDWLVADHYGIDHRWERALRPAARALMVIDDLADRPHDCDLLLDQNLGRSARDYAGLVPAGAAVLAGPRHALLRPDFARLRAESLARRADPCLRRLLVTMGGVDRDNVTEEVLDALDTCDLPEALRITVVMGPHAPWLERVRTRAAAMRRPTEVLAGVDDMARLMAGSDLAIGAAGGTSWERCCLGVPTIQLALAANQREAFEAMAARGAAAGICSPGELPHIMAGIAPRLREMSAAAAGICDGEGRRIVSGILLGGKTMDVFGLLRAIRDDELEMMRSWRNAPMVRANMYTRHEISSAEHSAWWQRIRQRADQKYFMYEKDGTPLGIVGFTALDEDSLNAAWAFYAAPDAPGGTGSCMEILAIEHAFGTLGLHKLYCEVLAFNEPVIALHRKFGFQVEGIFREHHRKDGEYVDIFRLGLLRDEWLLQREGTMEKIAARMRMAS